MHPSSALWVFFFFCLLCSSEVFKAEGHTKLISQLDGDSPALVANSAAAICNMAGEEVIHRSLLSNRAIQALVKPLSSTDAQVLVNTLHCLEVLACDTEARAEVGGYVLFKTLLPYISFGFNLLDPPPTTTTKYFLCLVFSYSLLKAFSHLSTYSDRTTRKCCKMHALLSAPLPVTNQLLLNSTNLGKTLKQWTVR